MSDGDEAIELAPGCDLVAKSANAVAAIENPERGIWAVQFHPEVHHTPMGAQILRNFVLDICGAKPNWTPQRFIDEAIAGIRQQVGDGHAICALSGGVDSAVAAVLVDRALRADAASAVSETARAGAPASTPSTAGSKKSCGESSRLTCVFVNHWVRP